MSSKTFLCRCEDLTVDDCLGAIGDGYTAFEDLKRFLGVGTGPCQGKACVQAAIHLIAEARGISPDQVDVMTFRPPVRPIPFETLAAVRPAETAGGRESTPEHDVLERDGSGARSQDAEAGQGAGAERSAQGLGRAASNMPASDVASRPRAGASAEGA